MSTLARLRDWATRDFVWLGLALFLALATYLHVNRLISVTASVPVALEVVTEKGLTGMVEEVSVAEVMLRGTSTDIHALQASKLRFKLRPRGAAGNRVKVRLEEYMLHGAGRLRVRDISPREVEVLITHERQITLDVAPPVVVGKPMQGRVEVTYEPRRVEVFGTGNYLDRMVQDGVILQTEPINIEHRTKSFSTNLKIMMPATTAVREIKPGEVRVEVNFINDLVNREFLHVPLRLSGPADSGSGWIASTNAVTVRVTGRPSMVERLNIEDIYAFAELQPVIDGTTQEAPVQVKVPNEMIIDSVETLPSTITLRRTTRRER